MRVGILSESDADEAGIRILIEAVLGHRVELLAPIRLGNRGWTAVVADLPVFFKALHWRPDADGLVAVIDSDDTCIHTVEHEAAGFNDEQCRCCRLHRILAHTSNSVAPRQGPALKIAIGLAVPAIEAWYQCGIDVHCTEARFAREPTANLRTLRRELKRESYGVFPAPQVLMKQKAVELAERLAQNITLLERLFPNGFGTLARYLRQW